MPGDLNWLARVKEEPLEPKRPICDPHHHLWDSPSHRERYLLDELLADAGSGHRVVSTVFVECAAMYRAGGDEALRWVGETEFAQGVAAMAASGHYGETRVCAGIVSRADLTRGDDVARLLDAHIGASPNRFRGVRHATAYDPNPEIRRSHTAPPAGLLEDAAFRRGFAELAKRNLSFDAWLYHHQIPELTGLARAFPETTIVFDHFGGPLGIGPYAGKRSEIFAQWKRDVDELARCENVVAKLGGLLMAVNGWGYEKRPMPPGSEELATATRGWYLHAIDRFGPKRCMFESNFPMDRVTCSYQVLWNSFKRIASGFSESEKDALFHDTAVRVYRL
ncbi:MAG TPA: amidohydrolase family protein [Myxococcota bacterium]|nr:amidohydrolase family protein [Myxococcota bacterium]